MTQLNTATLPSGNAEDLLATLRAHGVGADFVETQSGPSVSLHAFALHSGVSVAKFTNLARDLAVAVGAREVRLHAPIEGTTHVGVEVPNVTRANVDYEELRTSHGRAEKLPFPVGVGIDGRAVWADLTTTPHLLIAGTTGSGKSVALAALIGSLIEHRGPGEVRLHLIDPKRVELGVFADAPQVERVVTNRSDALQVLEDAVDLMDGRYEKLEEANCRNIGEWNGKAERGQHWAYHVIVIDELADLMMGSDRKAVEANIVRLAQLARAAGIHLVLATQRPTVDVVTGLIKANVPSRWAFTVASGTDSKVILDATGAQALTGKGDALWLPSGMLHPVRVQAAYITDDQVDRIVAVARQTHEAPPQQLSGSRADDGTTPYVSDLAAEYETATDRFVRDGDVAAYLAPRIRRVRDRSEHWLDDVTIKTSEPVVPTSDSSRWWHFTVGLAVIVTPAAVVVTVLAKVLG